MAVITRRYAVDVMPAGAYWRDYTDAEQKIDFAAVEESEGAAVQGSRLRLGLLLYAQRDLVIRWTQSTRFAPRSAGRVPGFMGRQILNEFVRIRLRGYYDGTVQTNRILTKPVRGLSQMATDRKVAAARRSGAQFVERVLVPVRAITGGAFAANGKRIKSADMLSGEIRAAYARWIDLSEKMPDAKDIFLASPLDVVTVAWRSWQERNSPITGFLEVMFRDLRDQRRIPELTRLGTQDAVVTEYNREANAAIYEGALKSTEVESLQYSAIRDAKTCMTCVELDGSVRPKDDYEFWGFYTPPVHPRCRCRVIPVTTKEAVQITPTTPEEMLRRLEKIGKSIPPGFGGYDPNA